MLRRRTSRGFSTVEMVASLVISAMLFGALYQLIYQATALREAAQASNEQQRQVQFAMDRVVRTISQSRRIVLPFDANPRTLVAVTLPASVDRDGDGFSDGDNDRDGRVDEDPGPDINNDGYPGIKGIDDDGDGAIDEEPTLWLNDDESGVVFDEDPVNGIDDDGDGLIDEDPSGDWNGDGAPGVSGVDDDGDGFVDEGLIGSSDDDEDGVADEDWLDLVVFYLNGDQLVERQPVPWDVTSDGNVSGQDYVEEVVLEKVQVFEILRTSSTRFELVDVLLEVSGPDGQPISLATRVRVGGRA